MLANNIKNNKSLLIHIGVLFLVCLAVFITNFPFDSWYTGWDNLHPEFNFGLNFRNGFSAVWQDNQGLGTFGGHGYAATLPHTLMTFLMSFIVPTQYIRSAFTFLCLFAGTFGMFFLIRLVLSKFNDFRETGALVGALYYMLNLATVQNFYIQLEAFIMHFALLPWLFLSLHTFLRKKTRKNFFWFFILSVLATAQGFIPPLFLVYCMMLGAYLFGYFIFKPSRIKFFTSLFIVFLTLFVNSYWLLPVVYYSKSNSDVYLNSYSNQASTEDFILKNKAYGGIKDVSLLKGFILESKDTQNGVAFPIFGPWLDHLDTFSAKIAGYALFVIIALGILFSIQKKQYQLLGFLIGFVIVFSFLANNTAPFSYITEAFQTIPQFRQAFRIAFTKFSLALAFYYAFFIGVGLILGFNMVKKYVKDHREQAAIKVVILFLASSALFVFSFPIFQGNLLYRGTKISIPKSYIELFDFFKTQDPTGRIADFPQGWHWGWTSTKWGYSGSGFLWYGIEQPILHRSFDVWGKQNENYYWEINRALYGEHYEELDTIFEKYQVQWVLFDDSIFPYPNTKSLVYSERAQDYFDSSPNYSLVKTFTDKDDKSNTHLSVYRFNLKNKPNNYISQLSSDTLRIQPGFRFLEYDQAAETYGNYIHDPKQPFNVYYPFRNAFTKKGAQFSGVSIDTNNNRIAIESQTPNELKLPIQTVTLSDGSIFEIQSDAVRVTIDPGSLTKVYDSENDVKFYKNNESVLSLEAMNGESIHTIDLYDLPQKYGYMVIVDSKHLSGERLRAAIIDWQSRKTDSEIKLTTNPDFTQEVMIIPPLKDYGLGYVLQLTNTAIGDQKTANDIRSIEIYRFPYSDLANLEIQGQDVSVNSRDSILVYGQAYNEGWRAYRMNSQFSSASWRINFQLYEIFPMFFGEELEEHILVNNWANGFLLHPDENGTSEGHGRRSIVIIFLPQYLEYLGFGMLLIAGTSIFYINRNRS
ncbi:hypothetical protein KBD81_02915 [Candidatus Woesebacteria bacterium]|nr:hypothetical protein [Candidatus Woesebacteria bacterium]